MDIRAPSMFMISLAHTACNLTDLLSLSAAVQFSALLHQHVGVRTRTCMGMFMYLLLLAIFDNVGSLYFTQIGLRFVLLGWDL